jgi:MoaA/NifB/PqqE/SkfB family radical SAM enzyme
MQIREDIAFYGKLAAEDLGYRAGQIEITSRCAQHCRACESWRDDEDGKCSDEWTLAQLQHFCLEIADTFPNFESLTLTGGDPLCSPHFFPFLEWYLQQRDADILPFDLHVSTALTRQLNDKETLLLRRLDGLQVSLDAVHRELYETIRGDKKTDPLVVLTRLHGIANRKSTTLTTLYPENVGHVPEILKQLELIHRVGFLRKAYFQVGLGSRVKRTTAFWDAWAAAKGCAFRQAVATSFQESVFETGQFIASPEAENVPCYASGLSFHIKATGDLYACHMTGGKAVPAEKGFRLGNVREDSLGAIRRRWCPTYYYRHLTSPCRRLCQWKQLQLNLAGFRAAQTRLD